MDWGGVGIGCVGPFDGTMTIGRPKKHRAKIPPIYMNGTLKTNYIA